MSITEASTTADILRAALDFMRRPIGQRPNRWKQGTYGLAQGCVCSIGAIRAVVTGDTSLPNRRIAQVDRAVLELGRAAGDNYHGQWGVIAWNDGFGRTFAEVEAAFEKAIAQSKQVEAVQA